MCHHQLVPAIWMGELAPYLGSLELTRRLERRGIKERLYGAEIGEKNRLV